MSQPALHLAPHRELFVKLLGAEEEDLAEGERHVMGDLREGEAGRIAAEEEIQDELLAGGDAGDETAAVLRKRGGYRIVRGLGVIGKGLERRSGGDNRGHGRRPGNRRNEIKTELRRLAALIRREDVARLLAMILRTVRDCIAPRDHPVHHRSDLDYRFLHRQFRVPFLRPRSEGAAGTVFLLSIYYYIGNGRITNRFSRGEIESLKRELKARKYKI